MAISVNVGATIFLGYAEFDQNGTPMITPVSGTTAWSNTTPASGTLTPSSTGQSAGYLGVAAGSDTVDFTLTVTTASGPQTFSASVAITVVAVAPPPQVLTSVQIVEIPALI